MTNTSLKLSKKIDPIKHDCFSITGTVAAKSSIPFFVVGATARDLILGNIYDFPVGRATLDIDIGVIVNSWDTFHNLKSSLVATGNFEQDKKTVHRLWFRKEFPVDIIPFGAIESSAGKIIWPPDNDSEMNVSGFQDAYDSALLIHISDETVIRLISLPGMAMLKILAWQDRHNEQPSKDTEDLALLLQNYARAGNEDRLFGSEADIMKSAGSDMDLAGVQLLGRDMAVLMKPKTCRTVLEIIEQTTDPFNNDRLIIDIEPHIPGADYERIQLLLENLKKGIKMKS